MPGRVSSQRVDELLASLDDPARAVDRALLKDALHELRHHLHMSTGPGGGQGAASVAPYDATLHDLAARYAAQSRLFEQIASTTPDFIYVFDLDGRFLYANRRLLEVWGRTAEEAFGRNLYELGYPQWHADMHMRELAQVIATRQPIKGEVPFTGGSGIFGVYEYIFTPVIGPDGNVEVIAGTTRDVTARKKTEEALRESEQRFRATFDQAAVGIAHVGLQGDWLRVNRRFCQILGYELDELRQMTFQDITHPDDLDADLANAARLQSGQISTYTMEKRYIRKDRSYIWVNLTGSVVRDDAGAPLYYIAVAEDITARKGAEETIQRSGERWALLAQTAADLLVSRNPEALVETVCAKVMTHLDCQVLFNFLLDRSTNTLRLNACRGVSADQARDASVLPVGQAVCGCVARDGARMIVPSVLQDTDARTELIRSLGIRAYACHPMLGADGRVIGTLSFGTRTRDAFTEDETSLMKAVTDLVAVAMERQRAEDELRSAKQAAEFANRAKDQFLAVLSHELRTPLTPVLATAEMLESDPTLPAEHHDHIRMIRRNVELEARLIDDLLDLTRIARNKLELHVQPLDVHEKIHHVVRMCDDEIRAKKLDISLSLKARNPHVEADPARFQQILWNLVKNATKFTLPGGRIAVETADAPAGNIVIRVADNGVGISPDAMPKIFDAFEQGDREITRQFGGLGLGLAISKALVEMHGGSIEAQSPGRGHGATFSITLPTASRPATGRSNGHTLAPGRFSCSVLLVEDHADTRKIMVKLITGLGCKVRAASTVAEARELASEEKFDILVSDIGLPDASGHELMRDLGSRYNLRGIALSGYGMDDDLAKSKDAGFVAHLTKPVSVQTLEDTLRRLSC